MVWQLCCRGMCKNLLRSVVQQRNYGKAKFPSNLNCGQKSVSETGPGSLFNVGLPCIRTQCICKWWFWKLPGRLTISCDWYFIYSMVVGVRKNMMLLFENKLSHIFCVLGAGFTNAEWAWRFVKPNQCCCLACWFVYLCVIFYHVFCDIWINCGYVWLRCCRIGDKCVVLFLKMWEIGVCSITKI